MKTRLYCALGVAGFWALPAIAQFGSGSDGSDGALDCAAFVAMNPDCPVDCDPATPCTVEIDLGLAATASWDTPSPVAGQGVYDPGEWAVVFKYTTIDVPEGVTVTFKNHPKNPPVVWLASGNVTVDGDVILDGGDGDPTSVIPTLSEPGPGGFGGGRRGFDLIDNRGGSGYGPGGGTASESSYGPGGTYGTSGGPGAISEPLGPIYGNVSVVPLIGGSGGGAGSTTAAGGAGAGGGVILIAASGNIFLSGEITANGGAGGPSRGAGGSGGAIRLIADEITGSGYLRALMGRGWTYGGYGRIRVEAYVIDLPNSTPQASSDTPGTVFPPANAPTLRATIVGVESVPTDPDAGVGTTDMIIDNADPVLVQIEATNIPIGTTVDIRIAPDRGPDSIVTSDPLVDAGGGLLTATALVTFPTGRVEMQLRANWAP